jgi:hypothetical protein
MKKLLLFFMIIMLMSMFFVSCINNKDKETSTNVQSYLVSSGKLSQVIEEVKDSYGNDYEPSLEYSQEQIKEIFGIDKEIVKEIKAQGPLVSTSIDTFVAIETITGKASIAKSALEKYKADLIKKGGLSQIDLAKLKASTVIAYDDYVFFILLGKVDKNLTDEAEITKMAQEKNKIAVDAIKRILNK